MRIYDGQIPMISEDITQTLIDNEAIEVEPMDVGEVQLDIQAVLKEYVRMDRELMEEAREIAEDQRSGYSSTFKIKKRLARQKNFKLGDEALDYIIDQLIEAFYHTQFIVEIFEDDRGLRRLMAPVLKKHLETEKKLDSEVRDKIKNLKEGSDAWDIEYQKAMQKLKRIKNLE